ncbi:MAG TPA: hypothetical protein PKI46_05725, partial [Bacteroidales bacterium]|nr:hypothetical protein [Bacteroidales bacterium]
MSYEAGATSINLGNQQVNIHPYQELTSLNANKLLLGLFNPGVYYSDIEISSDATTVTFTIKKNTTFMFKKSYNGHELVSKLTLQDDANVTVAKDTLNSWTTDTAIILIATWSYDQEDSLNIYASFKIAPYTSSNITQIETEQDIILAIILNHQAYLDNGSDASQYKISNQEEKYRNVMYNIFETASNYPITYGHSGISITIGEGNSILGDTYIFNSSTLEASIANGIWPEPVETLTPADYMQIDVLRIKTEKSDSESNTPYLQWESFLKEKPMASSIKEFIDGFDFVWEDIGYTLLIAVRDRSPLTSNTEIWPEDCYIINPFMPQLGIPETLSRF